MTHSSISVRTLVDPLASFGKACHHTFTPFQNGQSLIAPPIHSSPLIRPNHPPNCLSLLMNSAWLPSTVTASACGGPRAALIGPSRIVMRFQAGSISQRHSLRLICPPSGDRLTGRHIFNLSRGGDTLVLSECRTSDLIVNFNPGPALDHLLIRSQSATDEARFEALSKKFGADVESSRHRAFSFSRVITFFLSASTLLLSRTKLKCTPGQTRLKVLRL